jgi:lipid II:glycine glycyltransferase (peptidoglycan interpeptide bridge formation enzyme)
LLQTPGWAALKSAFGWHADAVQSEDARALVLFRRLAPGFTLAYIPRGPGGAALDLLLPGLDDLCRREAAFALKVEPDLPWSKAQTERLQKAGFRPGEHPIQPSRSIVVNLEQDEDRILAKMKQKTRYNIRLAERKGVLVRPWSDIAEFARMMDETGKRDGFGAHSQSYYQRAYDTFHAQEACELLLAEVDGSPVAAVMVFKHGSRAWYLYGASRDLHREKMPTYLLQWEAMRWAKSHGCRQYDLWGIPDAEPDVLEKQFSERSDGLWGVYRFKRGFGGEVVRSIGAWDRVYKPAHYVLYRLIFRFMRRGVG